jgi:hypothetical protein
MTCLSVVVRFTLPHWALYSLQASLSKYQEALDDAKKVCSVMSHLWVHMLRVMGMCDWVRMCLGLFQGQPQASSHREHDHNQLHACKSDQWFTRHTPYLCTAPLLTHAQMCCTALHQQCVSLKSDWAKGYSRLGAAYHGLGQLPEAIKAYEDGKWFTHSFVIG